MTIERQLPGGARVRFTGRAEGDMGHGGVYVHAVRDEVGARRRAVVDLPWTWLRQVHGGDVVRVRQPGHGTGTRADASITDQPGCALAVLTADCAPVALATEDGALGVVHAGWAGLLADVVGRAVKELQGLSGSRVAAVIGPCIHPSCYEFGPDNLQRLTDRFGSEVAGRTAVDTPALDLPAAVRAALQEHGVEAIEDVGVCTACDGGYYSWRARRERERQAAVVWRR